RAHLVQSGTAMKKPGASVRVSCQTSGYTFTAHILFWFRQAPGRGLEWVGWIKPQYGAVNFGGGFRDRVTLTRQLSQDPDDPDWGIAYMDIRGLKPDDTAVYYCARDRSYGDSSWALDAWGQGTTVVVSAGGLVPRGSHHHHHHHH
uniref:N6 FR3-03 heavy chain n=1 Tax=Homo sapiens TaxID=9606 RepID=UPI00102D6828|nr:Chain U, N6 FR3-03 heavy chain [Homo sapiens]